jgi:hypothetical protein
LSAIAALLAALAALLPTLAGSVLAALLLARLALAALTLLAGLLLSAAALLLIALRVALALLLVALGIVLLWIVRHRIFSNYFMGLRETRPSRPMGQCEASRFVPVVAEPASVNGLKRQRNYRRANAQLRALRGSIGAASAGV